MFIEYKDDEDIWSHWDKPCDPVDGKEFLENFVRLPEDFADFKFHHLISFLADVDRQSFKILTSNRKVINCTNDIVHLHLCAECILPLMIVIIKAHTLNLIFTNEFYVTVLRFASSNVEDLTLVLAVAKDAVNAIWTLDLGLGLHLLSQCPNLQDPDAMEFVEQVFSSKQKIPMDLRMKLGELIVKLPVSVNSMRVMVAMMNDPNELKLLLADGIEDFILSHIPPSSAFFYILSGQCIRFRGFNKDTSKLLVYMQFFEAFNESFVDDDVIQEAINLAAELFPRFGETFIQIGYALKVIDCLFTGTFNLYRTICYFIGVMCDSIPRSLIFTILKEPHLQKLAEIVESHDIRLTSVIEEILFDPCEEDDAD